MSYINYTVHYVLSVTSTISIYIYIHEYISLLSKKLTRGNVETAPRCLAGTDPRWPPGAPADPGGQMEETVVGGCLHCESVVSF